MLSKVQIKTIRSLQHKKYRQKSGYFLAEGIKVVNELILTRTIAMEKIYVVHSRIEEYSHLAESGKTTARIIPVTDKELKNISCLNHPQEVLALCKVPEKETPVLKGKITLLLEAIRDPGNLGTIIRIADWFGLAQIICSPDCVDTYNPKTIQASMGSIARVKVWYGDVFELIQENQKVPLFATALNGKTFSRFSKMREGIIAVGNESIGLSSRIMQKADECITIPRLGGAESLNAAVATGIVCSKLLLG